MISLQEWQNLLTYYITCIEKEVSAQSTFDSKSEGYIFETNFLKEEVLFSQGQETTTFLLTERLNRFLKKSFFSGKANKLYYGYPFVSFEDGLLVPVFVSEVSFNIDEENKTVTLKKGVSLPELNYSLLIKEGLVHEHLYQKLQEVDDLQREQNIKNSEKDKFLEVLRLSLNQTRFEEMFEIDNLKLEKIDISSNKKNCIHNQAFMYWGEANSYVKGLVYELNELKKIDYYQQLENTSLKYLFGEKIQSEKKGLPFIFSVLPLNLKQKDAIEKGLMESFTVVTGPPGTGKSQVLVNLIINALVNDQSVLFASKNNKAVDVVYERLDALTNESYVVRSGNRQLREAAFEELAKKAERIKFGQNKNKFLEFKDKAIKTINSIEDIKQQIKLRKEIKKNISLLNEEIEKLEKKYKWFKKNKNLKLNNKESFELLRDKYEKLSNNKKNIFEIINDLLFKVKTKNKLTKKFRKYFLDSDFSFFKINDFEKLETIFQELKKFTEYKRNNFELSNKKKELKKIPSSNNLQKELNNATKFLYESSLALYENKWLYNLEAASPSQAESLKDFIKVQKELNSNVRLGSRFYRLRERVIDLMDKVLKILPIWGVTNLAVKDSFPLKGGLFDLVVIDESSQCDIPSSIPLLFRAKRLMVIGDVKQLTHISTIPQRKDINYFDDCNVNLDFDVYSYNEQSLFKIADRQYSLNDKKSLMLTGHYRCHKEIIDFSNNNFYGEQLEILTDTNKFKVKKQGFYWYDLKGDGKRLGPGNIFNMIEIEKVTEMILKLIKKYGNNLSYGIITPFTRQASIIKDRVLKEAINLDLNNLDLTIWTVHKFQGDEKDIIIFSPVVTNGLPEGTINFVNNNPNLLNVAVTRAKQKLIVVGDLSFALEKKGLLGKMAEHAISLDHVIKLK